MVCFFQYFTYQHVYTYTHMYRCVYVCIYTYIYLFKKIFRKAAIHGPQFEKQWTSTGNGSLFQSWKILKFVTNVNAQTLYLPHHVGYGWVFRLKVFWEHLMKMEPSDSRKKITWTWTLGSSLTVFQDQVMSYTAQGVTLIEICVTQEHNTV